MKPLNAAERKKTFINFLIFFIVTAIVMVTTIFFSIQVPLKQNEQLRSRLAEAQNQQFFSATFTNKMLETLKLLDSVNMNEMQLQTGRFDAAITANVTDMHAMALRDSATDRNFYQGIATSLAYLQDAKRHLRDASGKDNSLLEQSKKIDDLTKQLTQANIDLQNCRLGNLQH